MKAGLTLGLLLAVLSSSSAAHAWGDRGHDLVCGLSLELIQNQSLRLSLKSKAYEFSRTCLVPDEDWKRTPDVRAIGDSTHWLNPEQVGKELSALTADDQLKPKDAAKPVGSLWVRAEQFYRMACDPKQEVASRMQALGYLGHFVADATQPLHLTLDYDGVKQGKKGLHFVYEVLGVEAFGSELWSAVKMEAKRLKKAKPSDFMTRLKAMSVESRQELDQIVKKSPAFDSAHARETVLPETAFAAWKPFIVNELARATALLSDVVEECASTIPREALRDWAITRSDTRHPFIPLKP